MSKYFFLFLITLILLLSGCGGECKKDIDCDDSNDCTTNKCFEKECVFKPIADCTCGNKECEADKGENECICQKDCGRCFGKVGEYLEKSCDADKCVTDVIAQEPVTDTEEIEDQVSRQTVVKMIATYGYDKIFNIDKSLFNVMYRLDTKKPNIRNLRIDKIQVMEVSGNKVRGEYPQSKVIGELSGINRMLWDEYSDVIIDIMLGSAAVQDAEKKTIVVKTLYSYDTIDSKGNPTTNSRAYLGKEMEIVLADPSKEQVCPPVPEWDDSNECTIDSCSETTNYFVLHDIKQGACAGNYVCESGENRCTVPQDCGSCRGQVGEYIRLECDNNKCMSVLINPDVIQQKKTVDEKSLPSTTREDIKFAITLTYDEPFDMSSSAVVLKLEVMQKKDTTGNFKVTRMQLLEGDHELGVAELSQGFSSIGEVHELAIGTDFSLPELQDAKETVLKVYYSYDGVGLRGEPVSYVNEVFELKLPEITFINAGTDI